MIDKLINSRTEKIKTSPYIINKLALALCAERMTPLYTYFCYNYKLDEKWYTKKLNSVFYKENIDVKSSIDYIEKKIPDSENYPELWATQGQCAVLCLIKEYDFINNKDHDDIASGYDFMDEAIDLYCQEATELGKEEENTEKLFIEELNWQLDVFNKLALININNLRIENIKHSIPIYSEVFN